MIFTYPVSEKKESALTIYQTKIILQAYNVTMNKITTILKIGLVGVKNKQSISKLLKLLKTCIPSLDFLRHLQNKIHKIQSLLKLEHFINKLTTDYSTLTICETQSTENNTAKLFLLFTLRECCYLINI